MFGGVSRPTNRTTSYKRYIGSCPVNYAYDRLVDDAIDAATEEAAAMGITDDAKIDVMIEQYTANELRKWE